MPPLREPTRTRLACALVALALLPACSMPGFLKVAEPEDGVTVKNLTADLAFGAEEQGVAAESVGAPPQAPAWEQAMYEFLAPDFDVDFRQESPRPPAAPVGPCPEPDETTFPELPATLLVNGPPVPGLYRWKHEGTVEIFGLAKVPLSGLTTRTVRLLDSVAPGVVAAYEIEQQGLTGTEIDTIEIRYSDAGSPTDGVYLTRLQYRGPDIDIDFNPPAAAAPKLLSLPVRATEPISETAIDLDDRLVLQVTGTMDGSTRHRLDTCGEVVEAWKFSGQRILQGLPPNEGDSIRNTKFDFWIAPQLGGLIVGDHLVTQGNFGPLRYQSDIVTTIGDLAPRKG
jgi:hypothetical protein